MQPSRLDYNHQQDPNHQGSLPFNPLSTLLDIADASRSGTGYSYARHQPFEPSLTSPPMNPRAGLNEFFSNPSPIQSPPPPWQLCPNDQSIRSRTSFRPLPNLLLRSSSTPTSPYSYKNSFSYRTQLHSSSTPPPTSVLITTKISLDESNRTKEEFEPWCRYIRIQTFNRTSLRIRFPCSLCFPL